MINESLFIFLLVIDFHMQLVEITWSIGELPVIVFFYLCNYRMESMS